MLSNIWNSYRSKRLAVKKFTAFSSCLYTLTKVGRYQYLPIDHYGLIIQMHYVKDFYSLSQKLRSTFADLHTQFVSCLNFAEQTQREKLQNILQLNQYSQFGQEHHFDSIKNIDNYRQQTPIREYDDYLPYIDLVKAGQINVLTQETVECLEPTSGSTGYCKLIPYTKSLYQDFQNGIAPWLYDLYKNNEIADGSFYWSITPALKNDSFTKSKIPIGSANDFGYFTQHQQEILQALSAVPFEANTSLDIDHFKENTLKNLLPDENLSFVSVWNPSFLTTLLDYFHENAEEMLLTFPDTARAIYLKEQWKKNLSQPNEFYEAVWPKLTLISCWADANAEPHAKNLRNYFSKTRIQGKGLISTEAFVSFPFENIPDHILAIRSNLYEFKPLDATDNTYLAHELEIGQQYEVIVTTSGGLYRYNLHDVIEITGYYKQTPLLRFVGRNHVIDHVGEKINELQLTTTLKKLQNNILNNTRFLLCSPERDSNNKLRYTVFIDTQDETKALHAFAEQLEESLVRNFHYRYARQLGQLEKVRIYKIRYERNANEIYLEKHFNDGKQLGQIKPAYVDKSLGWSSVFKGEWL